MLAHRNPLLCPIVPPVPKTESEEIGAALTQVSADVRLLHTLRRLQAKAIVDWAFIDARGYEREVEALGCRIDGFLEALSCVGAIGADSAFMYQRAAGAAQRPIAVNGASGGTTKAYNEWRAMVERLYVDSAITMDDVRDDA